jgi:peptidoglycan/LPS O-acetylase OafA/YrhL
MDRLFAYITFTIVLSSILSLLLHPLTPYILVLWAPMGGVVAAGFVAHGFVVYRLIRRYLRRPAPFGHAQWVLSALFLVAPVAWWTLTLDFTFWSTALYCVSVVLGVVLGTRLATRTQMEPQSPPIV